MINLKGKSPKILVIGDLMVDHYLWGSCERISPEAPVQVINVNNESIVLGGAGNVINNLKALGAKVDIISVIGNCNVSNELIGLLNDIEIDTKFLFRQRDRITSKKSRVISSHQQVIRFDREQTKEISSKSQKEVLNAFTKIIKNYDIILLSDYGKGVLTKELTKSLIDIANENSKKVLVDPKGRDYSKYNGAFLLTPNKNEASRATGINIQDEETLIKAIFQLKLDCNLDISIITLSERGIAIYDDEFRIHPTFTREVFDVTGAGDTVLASLGFALACNSSIDDAIEFSNFSAGVVVGKIGSSTASINEIIEYESSLKKSTSDKHIKSIEEITLLSKELKANSKKIVFTNGCFDVIHAGHIKYLETSKSYGDILIVGLNSNRSVSLLKGPKRPFNTEIDRAYIIAALESVDYVVIFDEDTPYNLIKLIKPHTLTKGADYQDKKVIGRELVKELKLVDIVDGKGTSKLVDQIHRSK
jgi:D-beta-D-heptose 7-phosphate kinase / D-beta-D-heptose 1-phosphate adenosyltransferase